MTCTPKRNLKPLLFASGLINSVIIWSVLPTLHKKIAMEGCTKQVLLWIHQIVLRPEKFVKGRHPTMPRKKSGKADPSLLKKLMSMMFTNKSHNIFRTIAIEPGQESNNSYRIWNLDLFFVMLVSSII